MESIIEHLSALVFPSQLGWMSVSLGGNVICEFRFGLSTPQAALRALESTNKVNDLPPTVWRNLQHRLEDYAAGEKVDFDDFDVDDGHMTPFQKRVMKACRKIPYGETLSYGGLAARAGSPNAARAVGNIMSTNRVALIVPCHRVIGANGALGGYSAPDGPRMKQRLLALEGVSLPRTLAAV
jgi:methylated-DNA-[protein]-cysteine S-methyltransferase